MCKFTTYCCWRASILVTLAAYQVPKIATCLACGIDIILIYCIPTSHSSRQVAAVSKMLHECKKNMYTEFKKKKKIEKIERDCGSHKSHLALLAPAAAEPQFSFISGLPSDSRDMSHGQIWNIRTRSAVCICIFTAMICG
jgi:hypothetical protein